MMIKKILISIIIVLSVVGVYYLNSCLKNENMLYYSTGTDIRSFLNSTWRMSVKEVERSNGFYPSFIGFNDDGSVTKTPNERFVSGEEIITSLGEILTYETPEGLIDENRLQSYRGKDVKIWNEDRRIFYDFFDNQLFQIRIYDEVNIIKKTDSIIISDLSIKFGEFSKSINKKYGGSFNTKDVSVHYEIGNHGIFTKENVKNNLFIKLSYKPLIQEIINNIDHDKKTIF